jgi:hypothetical protein
MMIMLTGCVTTSAGIEFCDTYRPVYWSVDDTDKTVDQLMQNNVVYYEKCI